MRLGRVVVLAGLSGIVSFSLLVSAIATDHWYILEVNDPNSTVDPGELNSHSGLWRTCEGNVCYPLVYPFSTDTSKHPEPVRRLINMFKAVVILLPLSLVLLVFGGICGLVSSLSKSITLLVLTGSYFLLCILGRTEGSEGIIRSHDQASFLFYTQEPESGCQRDTCLWRTGLAGVCPGAWLAGLPVA